MAESRPRSLSSAEMRAAFGVRVRRKIGSPGVRVKHIDYQNERVMRLASMPGVREVEVLRWHGDVGTIGIRHDDGPWETASAADPTWIGKNDVDLDLWLSSRRDQTADERSARRRFLNELKEESYDLKALAGLISLPKTAEDLERDVARFSRHADTAEGRHKFGEYRDLLDDLDEGEEVPTDFLGASKYSEDDLME